MKSKLLTTLSILAILLAGSMYADVFIADDSDGDGVPDSVDACPVQDASFFDRDGDGCLDDPRGARHTEYWGVADAVITYVINESGWPSISDGSDIAALRAGMDVWTAVPNSDLTVSYGGTTTQEVADAVDQINLITMVDDEFQFGSSVLAVGITTSFTVDSLYNGRLYRPGEMVDADMIFNRTKNFTTTGGLGSDIQAVATHEGGHLYGLSHSAVLTAALHYVLPPGTLARTLSSDDEMVFLKAYPDTIALASANRISGTVTIGGTPSEPLPGAIVYVIDAASGDTTASDYTLPDGSYTFVGMPDGGYYISIYPIDGSSVINYMQPSYVNALVETTAVTLFVPEYWDVAESELDNAADKDPIAVGGGSMATADIITNIDLEPPTVTSISPLAAEDSVRIDAAMLIQFSEAIDAGTVSNNFRVRITSGPDAGNLVGGNAVILNDDSVLAFTPTTPYGFDTSYELTLNTDSTAIADKFGNPMAALFVSAFLTQPRPPLAIDNLAPNKGVVGSTIVINGAGFEGDPLLNDVTFNGVSADISDASPNRLVVRVPNGVTSGPVKVTVGALTSNELTFTLLSAVEIARGFEVGVSDLGNTPLSVAVTADGGHAYVATDAGASAVVVDAGLAGYLDDMAIPIEGGLVDLDITPDRRRVYGVSGVSGKIHVIDSDPADGPLFNQLLTTLSTRSEALGIAIEPTGRRAFVSTPDSVIQVWDINLKSATYQRQVGAIEIPDANLRGKMTVTPAGDRLLALSGLGNLYVCDLGPDSVLATVAVGSDPHDVVVDPVGQRAYVSDRSGLITVVRLDNMTVVQDITTGGSERGITMTPGGMWIYDANFALNHIDVVDLNEENPTFRSVAATIDQDLDPVDIEVSPDGFYAYSVIQSTGQLVATAIGLGPYVTSIAPRAGNPGDPSVLWCSTRFHRTNSTPTPCITRSWVRPRWAASAWRQRWPRRRVRAWRTRWPSPRWETWR
jgi:DNA-binding beta-propeller fold protein YncE